MNEQNQILFFPGKIQLLPISFNIAISPMLLYLSGLWPWPPSPLHAVVFILAIVVAVRFTRKSITRPRLIFDENGIQFAGVTYRSDSIVGVLPYMKALRVWINTDEGEKERLINLWWASKDDIRKIFEIATTRYPVLNKR